MSNDQPKTMLATGLIFDYAITGTGWRQIHEKNEVKKSRDTTFISNYPAETESWGLSYLHSLLTDMLYVLAWRVKGPMQI
jgi:hypothetical protein